MRKYFYIFVAATTMVLAGCQKETEQTINPGNVGKVTVLKASVAENNTKVSADAAGKFAWQAADAITAFDPEGNNLKFTTNAGGSATEFTFDGETALGSYALYPYNENHIVAGDDILVNLPAEYTYKADETNMPMLGKIENNAASFKAIGGVLKLIVYNIPESASKLTFTAANKQISGDFEIANASEDTPSIATANTSKADEKAVAINFTRSTNMVFYISLPTGEIDGFTLAFNDSDNTSKTVNASFTVGRNKIINAPALNLSPATEKVLWSESFTTELTGSGSGENETVSIANYNNEKNGQTVSSGTVSYSINSNTGTKLYKAGKSAKGAAAGELMLSKAANSNNGEFIVTGIPTEGATSATLSFVTNSNAEARATVSSNTEGVTIGKRSVSGSETPYTITYAIAIESGVNSFDITFSNSNTGSNTRIDDINLVATIGAVTITPTIEVGKESETISAGALTGSISGVKLLNPIDGTGIAVSSDVDWLEAAITEGDYLGAGAKLTATAKSYNHGAVARTATVTLKATGVTKTVTFKQNPSVVEAPTISTTAGNKTFTVTWTGDSKVESYVAYYASSELSNPSTGTALTISKNESSYTAAPTETLTNGTTYYVYVKASSLTESYSGKYAISDVWAEGTVEPAGINGTVDNPYDVASAIAVIENLSDNETTSEFYYVAGTLDAAPSYYGSGKLTFTFVDENSNSIKAYNCLGLDGANFSSISDLKSGDEVVVYGNLEKYVKSGTTTYEVVNGHLAKHTPGTGGSGSGSGAITPDNGTCFDLTSYGSLPTGWTCTEVDSGSYFKVKTGGSMVSPAYDLTGCKTATVSVKVAKFGSGTNPAAVLSVSYDGGATWAETKTLTAPTSSTYLDAQTMTLSKAFTDNVVIKLENPTGNAALRVQNFSFTVTE